MTTDEALEAIEKAVKWFTNHSSSSCCRVCAVLDNQHEPTCVGMEALNALYHLRDLRRRTLEEAKSLANQVSLACDCVAGCCASEVEDLIQTLIDKE